MFDRINHAIIFTRYGDYPTAFPNPTSDSAIVAQPNVRDVLGVDPKNHPKWYYDSPFGHSGSLLATIYQYLNISRHYSQ